MWEFFIVIKKAEHRRIDAFELWCWRRLMRVPCTTRRSNQSILKEISPRCSLEGLMLELKLQYFGHLMGRLDSLESPWCWEGLRAGGEGDDREWDGWMVSPTRCTWFSELRELMKDREAWCAALHRVKKSWTTEQLNWTELRYKADLFSGNPVFNLNWNCTGLSSGYQESIEQALML